MELLESIRKLFDGTIPRSAFCFFVDGLDEYAGDHFDLIRVLKSLMNSDSI